MEQPEDDHAPAARENLKRRVAPEVGCDLPREPEQFKAEHRHREARGQQPPSRAQEQRKYRKQENVGSEQPTDDSHLHTHQRRRDERRCVEPCEAASVARGSERLVRLDDGYVVVH
ncbi:MAG TPA: hypothetical protein VNF29_09105 [Candidatus Binataceae bacterium]|nr:hypothetical protein [Candidatus Binataceae bacterium]